MLAPKRSASGAMARSRHVEAHASAEEGLGVEVAEHAGGVGYRRQFAAAAVTGRAGIGAGALRADAHQAALVAPGDGAAAGTDRADVHRGDAQQMTAPQAAEPGVAAVGEFAVAHQADVEGGAAGVADDGVAAEVFQARVGGRGHRRHGRAGFHRVDRCFDQFGDVHAAAQCGRDEDVVGVAGRAQVAFQAAQVLLHQRLERGVDAGGRSPAVFADHRQDAVREGVGHAGQQFVEERGESPFMRRVGDRPEQAYGDRLEAMACQLADHFARLRLVEVARHAAVGANALAHLEGVAARNVGLGVVAAEVVRVELAALAQHEDVGKAFGDQQRGLSHALGDDGVGRPRGAIDEQVGFAEQRLDAQVQLLGCHAQRLAHPLENACMGGEGLADGVGTGAVGDYHVGEGATGIHGNPVHAHAPFGSVDLSSQPRRGMQYRAKTGQSQRAGEANAAAASWRLAGK